MAREKDKIMRKNLAKPSIRTLKDILGLDIESVVPVSSMLIHTILERMPDNLMLVKIDGEPLILHWEYQVKNDPEMVIRNAIYDYLIYQQHKLAVRTTVLYIGRSRLTMNKELNFCGNHYSCDIIDIRNLDPEIFLQSVDYQEVILAVLTGSDDEDEKLILIRKIITTLRQMLRHSAIELEEKLIELELLAEVRGKHIQQLIKKEVSKMNWVEALGIDKRKSLFYQEANRNGRREGKREAKQEAALNLIREGIDSGIIHKCTGISMRALIKMRKEVELHSVIA